MITVLLYGELGKLYGKVHKYSVKNAPEALRALDANFKGFASSIRREGFYKVIVDKKPISEDQLNKTAISSIKIIPLVQGAGKGVGQIIVGIALVWATGGFASLGYSGLAGASAGTGLWAVGTSLGISMVLGGVSQMLTKTPKLDAGADRPDNKPSYAFDGPVNTTAQGNPVPLAYGKMLVGSQVISAGLEARG